MTETADIGAEFGLKLSKAKMVMTKFGERYVREAPPTEEFWTAWRDNKDELKKLGFGVSKNRDNQWQVALWASTMSREEREANAEASRATDAAITIPAPEGMNYMPFQRGGIAYALKRDATLIGDEPGLGKTIQTIGFANVVCPQRILVVAPASLLLNWRNEINKWQTLGLPVTVVRPGRTFNRQPGWFVINFDIVNRYQEELKRQVWDLVVYDECQNLKTRSALRTLTLLGGKKKNKTTGKMEEYAPVLANRKLALTGTPIMNRPAELFPILNYLDPKRWPNWSAFARRYCGGQMTANGYQSVGATNLDELNGRLRETCLTGDCEIDTEYGKIRIDTIVSWRLPVRVWSCDQLGRLSLKPIVGFSARPHREFLVKIQHAEGELVCTPNHRIFTNEGEIRADQVQAHHNLLALRKANDAAVVHVEGYGRERDVLFSDLLGQTAPEASKEGVEGNTENGEAGMRGVFRAFQSTKPIRLSNKTVLLGSMSSEMGISNLWFVASSVEGGAEKGNSVPLSGRRQEYFSGTSGPQIIERASRENIGSPNQALGDIAGARKPRSSGSPASSHSTKSWPQQDSAAQGVSSSAKTFGGVARPENGFEWQNDLRGYFVAASDDNRGRRSHACTTTAARDRQGTGCFVETIRIHSVEILELGDRGIAAGGRGKNSISVFDIEVEDNHNFFANGVLVHNCMVRRLKADVLTELPPKVRQIVTLDVEDEGLADVVRREMEVFEKTEAAIASANAEAQRAEAEGDESAYKGAVGKLRAAQGIAFHEMAKVRHETAVAKLPSVIDLLKQTTGKVLVFAWHTTVIDGLCEALKSEGVVSITGRTPNEKRQPIVETFQKDENIRFFIGNIKAAGVGLTLTAASHVVFAELDWTPSSVTQAEDRAHRISQRETVLVQHVVLDGSLDAKMAKMILAKQAIIDQALDAKVPLTEADISEVTPVPIELKPEPSDKGRSFDERRARIQALANKLTGDQIQAIHDALRTVAAMDADRARSLNDMGFSKVDTVFGCELAAQEHLRPRQAAAAMKMVRKYRRQYSADLYARIFPDQEAAEEAA